MKVKAKILSDGRIIDKKRRVYGTIDDIGFVKHSRKVIKPIQTEDWDKIKSNKNKFYLLFESLIMDMYIIPGAGQTGVRREYVLRKRGSKLVIKLL